MVPFPTLFFNFVMLDEEESTRMYAVHVSVTLDSSVLS